jgi:hypothetical protein
VRGSSSGGMTLLRLYLHEVWGVLDDVSDDEHIGDCCNVIFKDAQCRRENRVDQIRSDQVRSGQVKIGQVRIDR